MKYFWVQPDKGKRTCVDAETEVDVSTRAAEAGLGGVKILGTLPYPSNPRVPLGKMGWGADCAMPSFCYAPNQCLGRSCCPQNYACTE